MPAAGALITVFNAGTLTKSSLYSDDGVTTATNPLTADINGRFAFYVADGRYDIQYSGAGLTTYKLTDIDVHDVTDLTSAGKTPIAGNLQFTGINTHSATETFTVTVTAKNLNNIRVASGFSGADWCAKVTAADSDLGAASGEIWIDTTAGTSACAAAPTLSSNHVLRFIQGGTYNIGVGWTITNQTNWGIVGSPGTLTTIQFTGSAGFTATGAGLPNGSFGNKIMDVVFSGGASVVNAVTLINVHRSVFDFSARNCTGVAVLFNGSLLNTGRIKVSANEGTFTTIPTGGVLYDKTVSPAISSNANDIYHVIEGVAGIGIRIANGSMNILRGTSEGNTGASGRGVQIDAGSPTLVFYNTILNMDLESNAVEDILTNGQSTIIQNSVCLSTVRTHLGATSINTWLLGGRNPSNACLFTTVDPGAAAGLELDPQIMNSATGNWITLSRTSGSSTGSFQSNTTANRFWTLPDATDTLMARGVAETVTGAKTFASPVTVTPATFQLVLGTAPNQTSLNFPVPAGNVTITAPNINDTLVGRATTDTLTNKTLTSPTISGAGTDRASLWIADQGTASTNGNFVLSAGWGATATATATAGFAQHFRTTITSLGAGQAANPTITVTLPTVLPTASTLCTAAMTGGTGTLTTIQQTTNSATAPIFTFNGTPVVNLTYVVDFVCGP